MYVYNVVIHKQLYACTIQYLYLSITMCCVGGGKNPHFCCRSCRLCSALCRPSRSFIIFFMWSLEYRFWMYANQQPPMPMTIDTTSMKSFKWLCLFTVRNKTKKRRHCTLAGQITSRSGDIAYVYNVERGWPTLVLEGNCPGCFPSISALTASDSLNAPNPGNQQLIGQE